MFRKILIANRGEIACRVMRTAKRMGIRTVAVFSEADAKALHVEMADEALAIGPPPARESYLRIDRIIDAAKRTGAEAIHPGYGFLSENPLFAEACAEAGIVFVGPPASAIRAMGSKAEAKRLMQAAGVPLVPGYHGEDQSDALLAAEAAKIGYPVLIKASAGGGGRGMRAVDAASDFSTQLAAARREAEAAFGDGRVLIEKYLQRPRHIEVQVLADTHGSTVHLGTRDCSIQRRHQKIIEEAPAPNLPDAMRDGLHAAAVAAAKACGYVNAGTVEFIAEGDAFYFMEMNTRLQVEHPVTETIYDLDLVDLQLRVAAGEKLPGGQDALRARGHAIETRVCAEDPSQDFRPSVGVIENLNLPMDGPRIDTGIFHRAIVSPHYDSLLAKVITWGSTREKARRRMIGGLEAFAVQGLATNLELLRRIVAHDAFADAALDTGFIPRHQAALLPPAPRPSLPALAAATLAVRAARQVADVARNAADTHGPWHQAVGFRLLGAATETLQFAVTGGVQATRLQPGGDQLAFAVDADAFQPLTTSGKDGGWWTFALGSKQHAAMVLLHNDHIQVTLRGDPHPHALRLLDPYAPPGADAAGADRITAPIPGTVLRVDVTEGEAVSRGEVLVVMEAMKTELRLAAPAGGTVARVLVKPGDMVQEGMELVQMTHEEKKA